MFTAAAGNYGWRSAIYLRVNYSACASCKPEIRDWLAHIVYPGPRNARDNILMPKISNTAETHINEKK